MTPHEVERRLLAADVAVYLASGKKIKQLPPPGDPRLVAMRYNGTRASMPKQKQRKGGRPKANGN